MATDKTKLVEGVLRAMTGRRWSMSCGLDGWRLWRNGQTLYASVNRHWLCLCQPVAVGAGDVGAVVEDHLLKLCHRMFMTKYSLDTVGQMLLQVEVPLDGLDRAYCQRAIEAMNVYAQRYGTTVAPPSYVTEDRQHSPGIAQAVSSVDSELVSMETLVLYFQSVAHLGWGLKDHTIANQWQVVYKGRERAFDGCVSFCRSWACFAIPLLAESVLPSRLTEAAAAFLLTYALKLNHALVWAKIGLDDSQIVLTVEMPLEAFDLRRFRWACRTLAGYADEYARDVQVLASLDQDEDLLGLIEHGSLKRK